MRAEGDKQRAQLTSEGVKCSPEETKIIESIQAKSDTELEDLVQQVASLIQLEEADFDSEVQAVQAQYEALVADFNSKLSDVKAKSNYKFVEQVMILRTAANRAVEEPEL